MALAMTSALPTKRCAAHDGKLPAASTSPGLFLALDILDVAQWRSPPLELPKKKPLDRNAVEKQLVSVLGNGEPFPEASAGHWCLDSTHLIFFF